MVRLMLVLFLILFTLSGNSAELDIMFSRNNDVNRILKDIHANGYRDHDELIELQRRALKNYRSAPAYKLILSEGLQATSIKYRRAASLLLLETFNDYLHYHPAPDFDDALALMKDNDSLTTDELIALRTMALKIFKEQSQYEQLLFSSGPNASLRQSKFLIKSFADFAQAQKTDVDTFFSYVARIKNVTNAEYIELQKVAITQFPDIANLPLLATLRDEKPRPEMFEKPIAALVDAFGKGEKRMVWLQTFMHLIDLGANVSLDDTIKKALKASLYDMLKQTKDKTTVLASITPKNRAFNFPLSMYLRMLFVQKYPSARQQIIHDCDAMPPRRIQVCKLLFEEYDDRLTPAEMYKRVSLLRELELTESKKYKKYQRKMEEEILAKHQKQLQIFDRDHGKVESAAEKHHYPVTTACPICLENVAAKKMYRLHNCGHEICKDCLAAYVSSQLQMGESPIYCTNPDCGKLYSGRDLDASKVKNATFRLDRIAANKKILSLDGASLCPNEYCSDAHIPDEDTRETLKNNYHRSCPTCNHSYCTKCTMSHIGMSCKKFEKKRRAHENFVRRVMNGTNKSIKPCPSCKVMIQKNYGCNHMTCTSCHHEFFWDSGRPYANPRVH